MAVRSFSISEITIPAGRREPMKGRICSIARSMQEVGLLQPIVVTKEGRLVAGRTRLEAAKVNGWTKIEATVMDASDLLVALAEIDENIERSNLSVLEEAQALALRKKLYLSLHPETAEHVAGANGSNRKQGRGDAVAESATASFAKDTAAKTGKAARTIRENVSIGENLSSEAAEELRGTAIENKKGELQELSRMPEKQQVAVAKKIKSGKVKSVKKTAPRIKEFEGTPADKAKFQIGIWADTVGRWLSGPPSIDEYREKWPGPKGDAAVKAATTLYEALKVWQRAIK